MAHNLQSFWLVKDQRRHDACHGFDPYHQDTQSEEIHDLTSRSHVMSRLTQRMLAALAFEGWLGPTTWPVKLQ